MNFAPDPPDDLHVPRWPAARWQGRAVLLCCGLTLLAAAFPWTCIAFAALWGEISGPIAVRTNVGFTCVMTSVLTALLVLAEGRTPSARESVRTACMVLMGTAAAMLVWQLWQGPGQLLGGSARHSRWFFAAVAAVGSATLMCRLRLPARGQTDPAGAGAGGT